MNYQVAAKGAEIFSQRCAECHAFGGSYNGKARADRPAEIPIVTDVDSWSQATAMHLTVTGVYTGGHTHNSEIPAAMSRCPSTRVWIPGALFAQWLGAFVRDLLEVPEKRPKVLLSRIQCL